MPLYYGIGTTCQVCLGACCLNDGNCAELTPTSCDAQAGAFLGLEQLCAYTTCVGACCLADGGCEEIGPDPCASAGGDYQGRGSACEPVLVGDLDCDGSLLSEWGFRWMDCLSGPEEPIVNSACDEVDLDLDGDVDLGDVGLFGLPLGYQACSDVPFPCCGNGIVEVGEQCDDGNSTPGDGCDALCRTECLRIDWQEGQIVTYDGNSWGNPASIAAQLLSGLFSSVYYDAGGVLGVGIIGTAGFSAVFTSASSVFAYLPAVGAPGSLNTDLVDPTNTSSGAFGSEVVTLKLNIDFTDPGWITGSTLLRFGDLTICGTNLSAVNGMSVREFAGMVHSALGGGPAPHTFGELHSVLVKINAAFSAGVPSPWARDHLVFGSRTCIPGTDGCPWEDGELVTYNQVSWGGDPTQSAAAALLVARFNSLYSTGLLVGSGFPFQMAFTSAAAVLNYLPQSGAAGPLNSNLTNPSSSSSGVYGGSVLALQLDVDFTEFGHISGTSGFRFALLRLCGLTKTPGYNGMIVYRFLNAMNIALGGGPAAYSYSDMAILTNEVSSAFEGGVPSQFAQDHLFNGECPCTPGAPGCGWSDGDMITYNQSNWGTLGTTANNLLFNRYFAAFPFGVVEIGVPGASGFSAIFTSPNAVTDYQPAIGAPSALNADLVDPVSTSSGFFGGNVLALVIDVAFTDAGFVSGSAPLPFGDLRVCGLTDTPSLNGLTVRQVLDVMNTAIGGGAAPYSYDLLSTLAEELTQSFESGSVSLFAQDHLFNGACP